MPKQEDRNIEFADFLTRQMQGNAALLEFLSPFQHEYNSLRTKAHKLNMLPWIDECPSKFLPHLSAMLGFELLDRPYATEQEQRNLLKWSSWIYARRGTTDAIQKICEILGFDVSFRELISEPFIIGGTALYSMISKKDVEWSDDFNSNCPRGWTPNSEHVEWRCEGQRYIGKSLDYSGDNATVHEERYSTTNSNWMIDVDFEVLGGTGPHFPRFGFYIYFEDEYEYLLVELLNDGVDQKVKLYGCYSGICLPLADAVLPGSLDYEIGIHTLRVWEVNNELSVSLDDTTLLAHESYPAFWSEERQKGLFVEESAEVAFDNWRVWKLNMVDRGLLFSTDEVTKKLFVRLEGTPAQQTAKIEYLEKILPNYVPFSVTVEIET